MLGRLLSMLIHMAHARAPFVICWHGNNGGESRGRRVGEVVQGERRVRGQGDVILVNKITVKVCRLVLRATPLL